jgi:hypothetical protein
MSRRMTTKLHEMKIELQGRRHRPIPEQAKWIQAVLRGHYVS